MFSCLGADCLFLGIGIGRTMWALLFNMLSGEAGMITTELNHSCQFDSSAEQQQYQACRIRRATFTKPIKTFCFSSFWALTSEISRWRKGNSNRDVAGLQKMPHKKEQLKLLRKIKITHSCSALVQRHSGLQSSGSHVTHKSYERSIQHYTQGCDPPFPY